MFTSKIIQHLNISQNYLGEIIRIKSVAWPYPFEKQVEWMNNNLKDSDIHMLLKNNYNYVAYLNLIDIEVTIDKKKQKAFGIGNVCSIEKGKGYGLELMKQANQYIIDENRIGLLFCKKKLVEFYQKRDWKLIEKNQLVLSFDNRSIETMIFNHILPLFNLDYVGRTF